jgi:hypothetical protein
MKAFRTGALVALAGAVAASAVFACVGDDPPSSTPTDADSGQPDSSSGTDSSKPVEEQKDGGGGVDADAGPQRFCATQSPPLGVTDFFCADFDGTKLDEGWTGQSLPDAGGKFTRNTDIFSSSPASLSATGGNFFSWEKAGAKTVNQIDVDFEMNIGTLGGVTPATNGNVRILDIDVAGATTISLAYTRGGNVAGAAYTGYYIFGSSCPSACAADQDVISQAMPVNVWTKVHIAWAKSGLVTISYNGLSVFNQSMFAYTSTNARVELGLRPGFDPPLMVRHAFDNFVVSVKRD